MGACPGIVLTTSSLLGCICLDNGTAASSQLVSGLQNPQVAWASTGPGFRLLPTQVPSINIQHPLRALPTPALLTR